MTNSGLLLPIYTFRISGASDLNVCVCFVLRDTPTFGTQNHGGIVAFGGKVKAWRERTGLKRSELERKIGKSGGYVTRVEEGRIRAPGKDVCDSIGTVLEQHMPNEPNAAFAMGDVWLAAAPERLQELDNDLYEWSEQLVSGNSDGAQRLTKREAEILELLRKLDGRAKNIDPLGFFRIVLHRMLTPVYEEAAGGRPVRELEEGRAIREVSSYYDGAYNFTKLMHAMAELTSGVNQALWGMFRALAEGHKNVEMPPLQLLGQGAYRRARHEIEVTGEYDKWAVDAVEDARKRGKIGPRED